MNNDLISRNAFVKEINKHMKNVYECDIENVSDFQDRNNSEESYIVQGLFEAFELIGNVPTAYDVDKVIKWLESELSLADREKERCARENPLQFDEAKGFARGIAVALEIVKSGF